LRNLWWRILQILSFKLVCSPTSHAFGHDQPICSISSVPYLVPNSQIQQVHWITQAYSQALEQFPRVHNLPQKKRQRWKVKPYSEEYSIIHSLEDLLEDSFQDIEGPLDYIYESPIGESSHPLLEGGGEEPPKTPPSTLNSHHSHQ
jgi:hypothetical protein